MDFIRFNDILDKKTDILTRVKDLDLSKIGHFSGFKNKNLSEQEDEEICKILLATAMNRGIGGGVTERAHCIRELAPQLDFIDGKNNYIKNNNWRQYEDMMSENLGNNTRTVYQTSKESKIDQKVICIYGIQIPEKGGSSVYEIQIWIKGRKLIDRLFIGGYNGTTQILRKPYIFGVNKDDYHEISFQCSEGYSFSKIKLLGYVDESLGSNIM